jgi:hypothetical protein
MGLNMKIANKILGLIGFMVFSMGFHYTLEASENSILGSDKPEVRAILEFIDRDNDMQIFLRQQNFKILAIQEDLTAGILKQILNTASFSKKMILIFENVSSGELFKYSCEWTSTHKLTDCNSSDMVPTLLIQGGD